jgi:hypothetical protein
MAAVEPTRTKILLEKKSKDFIDVCAELERIDRRLPKLASSCLSFSAAIVTGVGTCGLGKYADGIGRVVREQHLTNLFAKTSGMRNAGSENARLASIAAAQTEALQRAKEQREEQLLAIVHRTKVEKQQEALRKQQQQAEAAAQALELAQRLADERAASQRFAEERVRRAELEREAQRVVHALDQQGHQAQLDEARAIEDDRKSALKSWVVSSKASSRVKVMEVRLARAAGKQEVDARSQSMLDFRSKIESKDYDRRKLLVAERHAEHEANVAANEERLAEQQETNRKTVKTLLNAEIIERRRALEIATRRNAGRRKRAELEAIRSVSSFS